MTEIWQLIVQDLVRKTSCRFPRIGEDIKYQTECMSTEGGKRLPYFTYNVLFST